MKLEAWIFQSPANKFKSQNLIHQADMGSKDPNLLEQSCEIQVTLKPTLYVLLWVTQFYS